MKVLVTVTNYSKYCQAGKKILETAGCKILENPHGRPYTNSELKEIVSDVDGAIVGVDSWNAEIFQLASKLKGIVRFGVGVDNIDLEAANRYGIKVCNCPGINSSAVAEHAAALILSLVRCIPQMNEKIRNGEWSRPMFHEMKSLTIGFLGFGAIAKKLAECLSGFHPKMIAYDKYPNEDEAKKVGVQLVSQYEVLKRADIISIHLPATRETYHLIDKEAIKKMKDGVLIVNTARGSIVNEKELMEAIKAGKVAAIGTDVFEKEPIDCSNEMFDFVNYIATPHIAAETYENCEMTSIVTAQEVLDILEGREPKNRLI